MKWCERCGGPLRGDVLYADYGCRLCWLGDGDLRQPFHAGGYWWTNRDAANQPCPHASGWWLPEGARDRPWPPLRSTSDEAGLLDWLARYGWHEPVGDRFIHVGRQWT